MARETEQPASVTAAELLEAAEAVARNGRPRIIRVHGTSLAIRSEPGAVPARRRRGLTRSSALWSVVGAVDDPTGPRDIAENKHRYLAATEGDGDEPA